METQEHFIEITKDKVGELQQPVKPGHKVVLRNQSGAVLQVCLFPTSGNVVNIPVDGSFSFTISEGAITGKYAFLTHALTPDGRPGTLQLSGEIDVVAGFDALEFSACGKSGSEPLATG